MHHLGWCVLNIDWFYNRLNFEPEYSERIQFRLQWAKPNKDAGDRLKETQWLDGSKVLNPKSFAKNGVLAETVPTGAMVNGEAGHIALRGSAAGCADAGAAAPPPRAAPRRYWPGPLALRRLGTAHVRGLPAATWPPLTGSAYKRLHFPHRTTSSSAPDQCTHVRRVLNPIYKLRRNLRCLDCFNFNIVNLWYYIELTLKTIEV